MNVDDVLALLAQNHQPDPGILLDDGEYYLQALSGESGLLLRIRDIALQEEDDAECHGGYHRRKDGMWIAAFCVRTGPGDNDLENVNAEFEDRDRAIATLWLMRTETAGYRTGEP